MPIREYRCPNCRRLFEFLYSTSEDAREPRCPRCGSEAMERQLSSFAFVRGGKNPLAAIPSATNETETEAPVTDAAEAEDERDPGLYKIWEHARDGGDDGQAAASAPRPRRVESFGDSEPQEEPDRS